MLHLGKIELGNNLLLIYLKGVHLSEAFNVFDDMKGTTAKHKVSLKKYLLFLKKIIEAEKIPSHTTLVNMDVSTSTKFFESFEHDATRAEEIRFILMKIAESYMFVYTLPTNMRELDLRKDRVSADNVEMGMELLKTPNIDMSITVSTMITLIKQIEESISSIKPESVAEHISIKGLEVLSKIPLNLDGKKVLEMVSRILKISKRI